MEVNPVECILCDELGVEDPTVVLADCSCETLEKVKCRLAEKLVNASLECERPVSVGAEKWNHASYLSGLRESIKLLNQMCSDKKKCEVFSGFSRARRCRRCCQSNCCC